MYELVKRFGVEEKTRVTEGLGTDRGVAGVAANLIMFRIRDF